jgi:hypothetical protein
LFFAVLKKLSIFAPGNQNKMAGLLNTSPTQLEKLSNYTCIYPDPVAPVPGLSGVCSGTYSNKNRKQII